MAGKKLTSCQTGRQIVSLLSTEAPSARYYHLIAVFKLAIHERGRLQLEFWRHVSTLAVGNRHKQFLAVVSH